MGTEEKRTKQSATRGEMTAEREESKGMIAGSGTNEDKKSPATGDKTTRINGMIDTRKTTSRRGKMTENKTGERIA